MSTLWQDVRIALRGLARSPGFTAFALLALALGIGANAAVFSLADALLLRPVPAADPARIVEIWPTLAEGGGYSRLSHPDFLDFTRAGDSVFEGMLAYRLTGVVLADERGAREAELLWGLIVSGSYFDVLGVRPVAGRGFLPEEDSAPGAHPVVVLSHGVWQRRFGGDPGVVGRGVKLNGHPFTIVGIAPLGFGGTEPLFKADFWVPLAMQAEAEAMRLWLPDRGMEMLTVLGRLRDGVTPEQARAALAGMAAELERLYPDSHRGRGIAVQPPSVLDPGVHRAVAGFVTLLFGIVGIVLLMTCANLAGLLLARATGRQREIAVRLAIGASRRRLVRQLVTESAVLGLLGGALGLLVGYWLARLLVALPPDELPVALRLETDPRVAAFTLGLALVTGFVFGLAPALQASRPSLVPALKGAADERSGRARLRGALVVVQVALSLVLLAGAALFLQSLGRLERSDPGFDHGRLWLVPVELGRQGYDHDRAATFTRELEARVRTLPGVESVTWADFAPFDQNPSRTAVWAEPAEPGGERKERRVYSTWVAPGYFETMGIPLAAGRGLGRADVEATAAGAARLPAVVNENLARLLFPGSDLAGALGRIVPLERTGDRAVEVVGVARDSDYVVLGEAPKPMLYRPLEQEQTSYTLMVRAAAEPGLLANAVRAEVARLDPELAVLGDGTMVEHMRLTLLPARLATVMLTAFGALALLLGAIGVYGIVAWAVGRRTREIGVRVALGAQPAQVLALVLGGAARLAAIGIVIGLALAAGLGRLAAGAIPGVAAFDALAFGVVALVLAAVALLAGWLPARAALAVDPIVALRQE